MLKRASLVLIAAGALGLAACLPVGSGGGGGTPWETAARADGSPLFVFGMQETSGSTVHELLSGGSLSGSVVGSGFTFGAAGPGSRHAVHSAGSGYIRVPNASQLRLSGTTASYEMIVKSDEQSPTDWMTAQDFLTPSSDLNMHGFALYANGGGGPNTANIELFTDNQDGAFSIRHAFPVVWDAGWHDWVCVLDTNGAGGQSRVSMYRDGVLLGSPVSLGTKFVLSPNLNPMVLFGAWNAVTTTFQDWHGSIAGFAVYASALSPAQITARYDAAFG